MAGSARAFADDGTGFAVAAALQEVRPGHIGLATMRERVAMAGGWLRIESSDRGTAVSFWIPDGVERGQ